MNRDEIRDLREEYIKHELLESDVDKDPIEQFLKWFNEALKSEVKEPNAMVLSTVDTDNQPKSRIVLLKEFDNDGFVFYTNYQSDKGLEMLQNPRVALCFWWQELERQVRIEGEANKVSRAQTESYFNSRPRLSRLGAWASNQSEELDNRDELEARFQELDQQFTGENIPLPAYWGGYIIEPTAIEFWQGRKSRLHDRLRYDKVEDGQWKLKRRSP